MDAFGVGGCAWASHTPDPSLGRGDFGSCVLFGNERFECVRFPSREGIEGCVTVKGSARDEVLRDTISRSLLQRGARCYLSGFGWLLWV
mgnify:FL=1